MLVGLGDIGKDGLMQPTYSEKWVPPPTPSVTLSNLLFGTTAVSPPAKVPIYEGPSINQFTGEYHETWTDKKKASSKSTITPTMMVAGAAGLGLVLYLATRR